MRVRSPGLYVHVPFCATRCRYCDFYSVVRPDAVGRWLAALAAEAEIYRDAFGPFGTLYLGGGTPSLLGDEALAGAVGSLLSAFSFEDGFEFTIEANPDDLSRERLDLILGLGVNRISIGVQSFDDRELRILGRRHDAAAAQRGMEEARRAGFRNIGIDLIYAIPGQEPAAMEATLERALAFEPEHISCYELTLEQSSPLARAIESGELRAVGEETARDLFLMISERLRGRGYLHYEVSNYARHESLRSRHNSRYWDHSAYLGLGPSAHSFSSGKRWWNTGDMEAYCGALEKGNPPVAGSESLSESQLLLERLSFGFRTANGFPIGFFDSLPGGAETLAGLERESLLRIEKSRVVPTLQGYLLSDRLPLLFSAD